MLEIIDLDNEQFEIYQNVLLDGYSELVAMYLAKQNIKEYKNFLFPTYKELESPLLIKDASKAMKYFSENYKDFLLVGDYDTDGVTASAAVYMFIKEKYNYEIPVYIPERKEGYGLQKSNVDYAIKLGKKAIITVDNGIAAYEAVEYAKEKGLFVIITDHHVIKNNILPKADYVINTKRIDSLYSDRQLSGAAVAWCCLRIIDEKIAEKFLPLILLGTIADVVDLVNQNRIIAKLGTNIHKDDIKIKSIKKLLEYLKKDYLERELIEFKISPMINSSGRMENALQAFNFFISENDDEISNWITKLEQTNEDRKNLQHSLEESVMNSINKNKNYQFIFPPENINYPNAIVGILAGKVLEDTYTPTIVFYKKEKDGQKLLGGSGRAPDWFDFQVFLKAAEEENLLVGGGGHKLAVGVTIKEENKEKFINLMDKIIKKFKKEKKEIKVYKIYEFFDNKQRNIQMIDSILEDLMYLEPFGTKNPQPDLAFKFENAKFFNLIGKEKNHLKFNINGIDVLSFFNKYNVKNKGIVLGLPQKNIWFNNKGYKNINYQILLKNYIEK